MKQPQKKLAHKKFSFNDFNRSPECNYDIPKNECGTVGCMAGELPAIFPSIWKWDSYWIAMKRGIANNTVYNLATFFGINILEVRHLFYPNLQDKKIDPYWKNKQYLTPSATKREVVKNLERFLKIKGVL